MSVSKSLRDYQPTKSALAWTAVGSSILTMVVGFAFVGWVTGGAAERMAAVASIDARDKLASRICAANFVTSQNARAQFAELSELSSAYRRSAFVQAQPWALIPGESSVDRKMADLCARQIAGMTLEDLPVADEATVEVDSEVNPG